MAISLGRLTQHFQTNPYLEVSGGLGVPNETPWISILVVMVIHDDWRITRDHYRVPPIFVGNPQLSVMPNGMSQSWQVEIRRKFMSWSSIMIQPALFESLHFVSGSLSAHLSSVSGVARRLQMQSLRAVQHLWKCHVEKCIILKYLTFKK